MNYIMAFMAWFKHTPCTCKYIGVYDYVFEINGCKVTDYNCFEIIILVRLLISYLSGNTCKEIPTVWAWFPSLVFH